MWQDIVAYGNTYVQQPLHNAIQCLASSAASATNPRILRQCCTRGHGHSHSLLSNSRSVHTWLWCELRFALPAVVTPSRAGAYVGGCAAAASGLLRSGLGLLLVHGVQQRLQHPAVVHRVQHLPGRLRQRALKQRETNAGASWAKIGPVQKHDILSDDGTSPSSQPPSIETLLTRPPSASSRLMVASSTLSVVSVVLSIVLLSTCAPPPHIVTCCLRSSGADACNAALSSRRSAVL